MADEAAPKCMNFSIGRHSREVLDQMNEYRLSRKLCDIVLRAEDDCFPAHRVVLSAASKYFNGMFCNNMAECELKEVPLFGVSASTLRTIVDFAYTSEVDNCCNILLLLLVLLRSSWGVGTSNSAKWVCGWWHNVSALDSSEPTKCLKLILGVQVQCGWYKEWEDVHIFYILSSEKVYSNELKNR